MGGRWPYSCRFVGYCSQDLSNIMRSILVQFSFNFFSIRLVSVHTVHPYGSIYTTTVWKRLLYILSDRSNFIMINKLSISIYIRGSLNKFPDFFFRMGTFIETLVPFKVISSGCNALVTFQRLLEGPMEVLLCDRVNDLRHSIFHLLSCLITTASELREKP